MSDPDPASPSSPIPMLDLRTELRELRGELDAAVARVLDSGRFVLGPEVEAFEEEAAAFLGVRHAVGLNSGTDALVIALRAAGVGPGDEVVTTAFSFFATAEAIATVGATPVYADIDPVTFCLDPAGVEAAVTERTRAVLPVHLYGRPAAMERLGRIARTRDLRVIEDCAQSFGAICGTGDGPRRTGALGDAGCFSFYPTKNLGAYGDAGLLTTDSDDLAALARQLRNHGDAGRYRNELLGYNSRLDALQAAVLRVKLPHVERWNAERRGAAALYDALLADVPHLATPAPSGGHVYHQYTVRIAGGRRDAVHERLAEAGIASTVYYPTPLHRLAPVASDARLPEAERAAREVLSLPLWAGMGRAVQERVAEEVRAALG